MPRPGCECGDQRAPRCGTFDSLRCLAGPEVPMARRRTIRTAVATAVVLLGATVSGGTAAGAPQAAEGGSVAAVIASFRARIPALMDRQHIPGLALAVVDGDTVVWQQGFGSTDSDGGT